ncbi:hypothetical protein GTP23_06730 [Pseudoduganella sp. FT93W]|uniref:Transporter n=1 Tax=Duganella fentianensis TaxID=2692177 RepID=A0A845HYE1_9BURK|nr:hypothetical protein [Duganella fentianensis]MYN44767.1 hypothetical protein [Duganella fentianensis]
MELKYYFYCFADIVLIVSSYILGRKLLKKRNYLLGAEWLVVTFSATNLLINALTEAPLFLKISLFCDAFSRSFGIPVIGVIGLMAVTHRFKPTIFADVMLFLVGLVVTVIIWTTDALTVVKPYFYLVAWSTFSLYLLLLIRQLLEVNERFHALSVAVSMVCGQAIAGTYDFYRIPGDDDHAIFYTFAMLTWSLLGISLYFAYCALERHQYTVASARKAVSKDSTYPGN